jgi:hypothetical protein
MLFTFLYMAFKNKYCLPLFHVSFVHQAGTLVFLRHINKSKDRGNVYARTGHDGPEGEQRYSPTLSLT